jgi:hypothetical protein
MIALLIVALTERAILAQLPEPSPVERAVAFLAREVPQWANANHCYSCHNNGDAARALIMAAKSGLLANRMPLADTLSFLRAPAEWDANGPDGPFKDKKLARIQFAATLADATTANLLADREALARAAELVVELQQADGGWETDVAGAIGSPATYGRPLATLMATRVLSVADPRRHARQIAQARRWFHEHPPQNVLSASSTLLALADEATDESKHVCAAAQELIARGQSSDGGWGPFTTAPPEAFDTALVLLALSAQRSASAERDAQIARGRTFLVELQEADGSWPATTRPSGGESYAQRLSTTGWATQALIATRPRAAK